MLLSIWEFHQWNSINGNNTTEAMVMTIDEATALEAEVLAVLENSAFAKFRNKLENARKLKSTGIAISPQDCANIRGEMVRMFALPLGDTVDESN